MGSKVAVASSGSGVVVPGGKALGSKVVVASRGSGVAVNTGEGLRVAVLATGWKGVVVGVASGGTVTRYRIVGVLAGSVADGFPKEAEQPVIEMIRAIAKRG